MTTDSPALKKLQCRKSGLVIFESQEFDHGKLQAWGCLEECLVNAGSHEEKALQQLNKSPYTIGLTYL